MALILGEAYLQYMTQAKIVPFKEFHNGGGGKSIADFPSRGKKLSDYNKIINIIKIITP